LELNLKIVLFKNLIVLVEYMKI